MRNLFERPTIASLAASIEEAQRTAQGLGVPRIHVISRDQQLPLSFAQERLWFLDEFEPNTALFNIPIAVRLSGALNAEVLERSLSTVAQRHEVLRTTFATVEGRPVQVIAPSLTMPLSIIDLSQLPQEEREAQTQQLAQDEARQPFSLAQGPLIRAQLLRLAEQEHILLLTMHHIISDGWSLGVLVREVVSLYRAFCDDQPSPLLELPIQYADFAHWQREWLQGEVLDNQLAYWTNQLADIPPAIGLPTDHPRPAIQSFRGSTHTVSFSSDLSCALKALSRDEEVTLFMTLLAAFNVLLHRYTAQDDIVIGSVIANRNRAEIEPLIGFFVNTLALRTNLSGNLTFHTLVQQVREISLDAYGHQDLPFEKLVEALRPERNLSSNASFSGHVRPSEYPVHWSTASRPDFSTFGSQY